MRVVTSNTDQSHPLRILAVHQGYELYGSDRSFIDILEILRLNRPEAEIHVVIPESGALEEALQRRGFRVNIRPIWVLRRSYGVFGILARLLKLPASIWEAYRHMLLYDFVYINTCVIFDYYVAARWVKRVVAHVREIPSGLALIVLKRLLMFSRAHVIFNSFATAEAFRLGRASNFDVVYNGVEPPVAREGVGLPGEALNILMLGRINDWKGQDLLVEALSKFGVDERNRIRVRIVGGAFGEAVLLQRLQDKIRKSKLEDTVEILDFENETGEQFKWSDVVVVPSRRPEPFGRVAIEAMSFGKAVVAAGHGGLLEIVQHRATGIIFRPNDADDLSDSLRELINNPQLVHQYGLSGEVAFREKFSLEALSRDFMTVFSSVEGKL